MKKLLIFLCVFSLLSACNKKDEQTQKPEQTVSTTRVEENAKNPPEQKVKEESYEIIKEDDSEETQVQEENMPEEVVLYEKLRAASKVGNLQEVKKLISEGADVNCLKINEDSYNQEYYEMTPLMLASKNGHLLVVKELIKAGANLDQITLAAERCPEPGDDSTALDIACHHHVDIAIELAKAGTNARSILYCASAVGNLELLKIALEKGADVNTTYGQGISPLMLAAEDGYKDIVIELIKAGADVNYSNDDYGETYSVLKSASNYPEITKLLKAAGAKE